MDRTMLTNAFSDFKLIGLNLRYKHMEWITCILLTVLLTIIISAFMELFGHKRYEIDFIVLFLETQAVSLQAVARLIALALKRTKLLKIVSDFNELKNEFNVTVIERRYERTRKRLVKIFSFYKTVCIIIIIINLFKPYMFQEKQFSYFLYNSEILFVFPYYYLIYTLEILFHYISFVIFVSLDILFVVLVQNLYMHLQMLRYRLRNLNIRAIDDKSAEDKCLNGIKRCVYYHVQLIRIGKMINEVFSFLLISLIVGIQIQFCVGLYMLVYDRSLNFARVSNSLSKLVGYNLEFVIYCYLGTVVNKEFSEIADAVYGCGWEMEFHPRIKKALVIIIQYSQKDFYFTSLNLIQFTLDKIISVWQTTFSLYTLLQNMKEK